LTGARFIWRNAESTLRSELVWAQSDHRAPRPEGNGEVLNRGRAYTVEAGYDLLKNYSLGGQPMSIVLAGRREHSSPVFRSLGSSFLSNYPLSAQVMTVQWGSLQAQLQGLQRFDNVDEDRRYVRNRVSAQLFNVMASADWLLNMARKIVPVDSATSGSAPATTAPNATPFWVPSLSLSRNVYNQFADEGFIPEGYFQADLPKIVSTNHAIGFDWRGSSYSVSWKSGLVGEKNLQTGETLNSSARRRHGLTVDWRLTQSISLSASSERSVGERLDTPIDQINRQNRARVQWRINTNNDVSLEFTRGQDFDTADTRSTTNRRVQAQWTSRFGIPLFFGQKSLPAQFYLRFIDSDAANATRFGGVFSFSRPGTSLFQAGITISLF
jgi:hypothetical protein